MSKYENSAIVHALADVASDAIGDGTRIWQFVVILPGAKIGAECNICAHVFIENDVIVGDRVTIKCGVQLWDGLRVGDYVFIGPNATFTNDKFPRSKQFPAKFLKTIIENGGFAPGQFPVAERMANQLLSLPMGPQLQDADVDVVIAALQNAARKFAAKT
jgi:NDP-sugar pyrophosphorylase family protein